MQSKQYQPSWDAVLALSDGTIFRGKGFGAAKQVRGELDFSTAMIGYQEVSENAQYQGKIVCMTYPIIGSYGVHGDDPQPTLPIAGMIVRELADYPSNWRSVGTFDDYLREHEIAGIAEIDTRQLTHHIRAHEGVRGIMLPNVSGLSDAEILSMIQEEHAGE